MVQCRQIVTLSRLFFLVPLLLRTQVTGGANLPDTMGIPRCCTLFTKISLRQRYHDFGTQVARARTTHRWLAVVPFSVSVQIPKGNLTVRVTPCAEATEAQDVPP